MAKGSDKEHFEDYRAQTAVKHEILSAYLPAYFHILKRWDKNVVFIDGFAGRGTYTKGTSGEIFDGSPLRALKLIAGNNDFSSRVSTIFIEKDAELFARLKATVSEFYDEHRGIKKPICLHGTFADILKEVLDAIEGNMAPTFLFVDPCGVSGASFEAIRGVMASDRCEAFIFFNIDGVRRITGLEELSEVLVELLGSRDRAQKLHDSLRETDDTRRREEMILSHYATAIREEIGAQYIVRFRVESEGKRKTSHYLIHASKHPLGFRIMKDVMWRHGHSEDQVGGLELAQRSRTRFRPLFDLRGDAIKRDIIEGLKGCDNKPQRVALICERWPERPEDQYCETVYRATLLELEADGVVEVLSKDGRNVVGPNARRQRKGKPTLGRDYFVRLRANKA